MQVWRRCRSARSGRRWLWSSCCSWADSPWGCRAPGWLPRCSCRWRPWWLEVCNGLAVHQFAWDDVSGFEVPDHGPVKLLVKGRSSLRLTALARRDLARVLEVGTPA
jgi:hypothetical protein